MRNKISCWLGVTIIAMGGLIPVKGMAADATIGADFNSAYVWRGLTFNDGFVIQPSMDVTHPAGFGFNVWGNWDESTYNGEVAGNEFSEVDLTVSYALPIKGPVDISIGVSEYLFPKEGKFDPPPGSDIDPVEDGDTREWFLSLSGEPVDGLTLNIDGYYDSKVVNDYYANAGASYSFEVGDFGEYGSLSLEISAGIGFASKDFAEAYASGTKTGFFDWNTSLSGSYTVNEALELGAFVTYVDNVDSDVMPDDSVDVNWFGGGRISYGF